MFDERDEVVVTAELPGAKDAEIAVELKGDMLIIETKGERRYAKEIDLPARGRRGESAEEIQQWRA